MTQTMDPGELRSLAHQCRQEADKLGRAIDQLNARMSNVSRDWTGAAAQSLLAILDTQIRNTREAATCLRNAAHELDLGAQDVQRFRDEEREREERERRERERQRTRR